MILPFSDKFKNGEKTYFAEKMWASFLENDIFHTEDLKHELKKGKLDLNYLLRGEYISKNHTIREDKLNRWKAGNKIHAVYWNRTKKRYMFAPVFYCKSVQKFQIMYENMIKKDGIIKKIILLYIDNKLLPCKSYKQLAINDGFDNVQEFLNYFNSDFSGKIIHWTDLRY